MKLKNIGYAVLVTAAAAAFVLGTAGTSEAAKKKAAKPVMSPACTLQHAPVCGSRGGKKFTYTNACFAGNDGAVVTSGKACPPAKAAKKGGKKKAKKAMKPRRSNCGDRPNSNGTKKRAAAMQRPVFV